MSNEKPIRNSGKRRGAYADKVRKEIPYHLGRDTYTLSNNQMKLIGRANNIEM